MGAPEAIREAEAAALARIDQLEKVFSVFDPDNEHSFGQRTPNDLHKGRHTGRAWAIDVAAVFLIVLSVTGLGLLLYLKRLRRAAPLTALVGIVLTVALMRLAL